MIRFLALCILLLCTFSLRAFGQDEEPENAIPVFYTRVPPHLLAIQLNFSAGTGRLTRSDKPLLSASGEIKGMYNISGALYLYTGASVTLLHSESRPPDGSPVHRRDTWLGCFPSGIGFTMGDDHAMFITGVDILPGFYLHNNPKLEKQRIFTYGIGPEFGFLFRAGPRYHKGLLIGMVGKLQFMQLPDLNDGPAFRYTYGGIGLVVRFY
jgi:hypothetical protein